MNTLHSENKSTSWIASPSHTAKVIVFVLVAAGLIAWATPPVALVAGMIFTLCLGNPFHHRGHKIAKRLLQICVVMLGFGMNLPVILRAGWNGSLFAALTISTTLLLGYWIGRRLDINRNTSMLISAGTAICGGSAIAAVGSVLAVTEGEIAVAMGTVFLLNAIALYLFPFLGHALHLSQHQFGIWAGVAIHDVSSVVGATLPYGNDALETATAVKLSRTLWIVALTLGLVIAAGRSQRMKLAGTTTAGIGPHPAARKPKVEIPWFIAFFLLASLARSYLPVVATWSPEISHVAKGGLTLVLCLIGASLSPRTLHTIGWKAAVQGILLWAFISIASLLLILYGHAG
jgi:uncharacterized integral membrane protein (TIGR00698 family)